MEWSRMCRYPVVLEVAGPMAMFSRPDTGGAPTSYPTPTWSAAKGIFESIAFLADGRAWICPTRVQVCRRVGEKGGSVRFQSYTTNYGGPLRKDALRGKGGTPGGSSMQLFATVLADVCYRIHGVVAGSPPSRALNPRHHLKDLFERRLRRGECFRTPCLGWAEFTCSYWGPCRDGRDGRPLETEVDDALTLDVPSMLVSVWDRPVGAREYKPMYSQQLRVVAGELQYDVPSDWLAVNREEGCNGDQ